MPPQYSTAPSRNTQKRYMNCSDCCRSGVRATLAIVCLATAAGLLHRHVASAANGPARANWSDYGGSSDSAQYSSLKQINKANAARLEQVWFYPVPGPSTRFGFNPVVVDGVMYVLGKDNAIVALDA